MKYLVYKKVVWVFFKCLLDIVPSTTSKTYIDSLFGVYLDALLGGEICCLGFCFCQGKSWTSNFTCYAGQASWLLSIHTFKLVFLPWEKI